MDVMYREIAHKLRGAYRVLFITGAGVSADSGLPTYRGVGGLYNDGETEEGLSIEDALSGDCFAVRPDITWKYLAQIQRNCRGVQPNAAHFAIADLERSLEVVVLTQNVDGLHVRAGSTNVIEIHGTLNERYCPHCGTAANADAHEEPPTCAECGKIVRPNVVLFGEALPDEATERLYDVLDQGFDMVFVIGTSAVFPYIVEPVVQALRAGIPTVEINPTRTKLSSHVSYYIPEGAAVAMTAICELMVANLP
jgi:NAD-dependent deacetylase